MGGGEIAGADPLEPVLPSLGHNTAPQRQHLYDKTGVNGEDIFV